MNRSVKRDMRKQGFTLVEIALALGIFAFAIVAIMALFPVGLRSANESRVETIVTQIARTVLSDLRTGPFNQARIFVKPIPLANGQKPISNIENPGAYHYIAYDLNIPHMDPPPVNADRPVVLLYSDGGKIQKDLTQTTKYTSGDSEGAFIVKVESRLVQATAPVLAQVTVTVESPAAAPSANRTKYPVVTLMGDTR